MLPSLGINKKRKVVERPLRVIELDLFPPTSRNYPRFDYEEICRELKLDTPDKRQEETQNEEFRDRDADEIVRRLEAKYGTGVISMSASTSAGPKKSKKGGKKVHKFAPEDVMDKGLGYVQEDDFIDDTEAYDEWVPTTMDTAKRGHYVNKGPLEFRQLDLEASTTSSTSNESESSSTPPNEPEQLSSSSEDAEIEDLEAMDAAETMDAENAVKKKNVAKSKKRAIPDDGATVEKGDSTSSEMRAIHWAPKLPTPPTENKRPNSKE